jgi:hypothetical protein
VHDLDVGFWVTHIHFESSLTHFSITSKSNSIVRAQSYLSYNMIYLRMWRSRCLFEEQTQPFLDDSPSLHPILGP